MHVDTAQWGLWPFFVFPGILIALMLMLWPRARRSGYCPSCSHAIYPKTRERCPRCGARGPWLE